MKKRWLFAIGALVVAGLGESVSEDMSEAYRLTDQARQAARADRNRESAALFRKVIKGYPSLRRDLIREYADQLLYSGRPAEAIPLFRETLASPRLSNLDLMRTHKGLALALLWSGQTDDAVGAYGEAVRLMPGDKDLDRNYVEALVSAGRAAARQDRNRVAADRLGQAIERAPQRRRELLREYADQLTYSERPAIAVPLFREVLTFPDLSTREDADARRNLALALHWSGQHDAAIVAYNQALARVPDDPDLHNNRVEAIVASARLAASRDQNTRSVKRFGQAIRAAPRLRSKLLREYADQMTYAGNPVDAVNLYRELIADELTVRQTPSIGLLKALGLAHLWAGQHEAARETYEYARSLGANDPDTRRNLAEALVGLGRDAGGTGNNVKAAELFRDALDITPDNRPDWLKEYADQLTYSERAADAVPFYERLLLKREVGHAERMDLRMSLALARSWSGGANAALAEYEAILREDPGNRTARLRRAEIWQWQEQHNRAADELRQMHEADPSDPELNRRLARVESYLGNHRRAIALAEAALETRPGDTEAAIILAESRLWMGRSDLAAEGLVAFLKANPGNTQAQKLLTQIERSARPRTEIDLGRSGQSDNLDITWTGLRHSFRFNGGRTRMGPQLKLVRYDPQDGSGVDVARVGGFVAHRFNDYLALNSTFFLDFQKGGQNHIIPTHDTYLTIYPSDAWRIDLGASRATLDNIKSLDLGLAVDSFGGSVDFWATPDTKLTGRASWARYTDGNRRWLAEGEVRQRIHRGPDVWIGGKATTFKFAEQLDNGYFNPEKMTSAVALVELSGRLTDDIFFQTEGTAGLENALPDGKKFIWSAGLTLGHALNDNVTLLAHANHFSSRLASDSGFARTGIGIGMRVQW